MKEKTFKSWSRTRKLGKFKYTLLWVLYEIVLLNVISGIIGLVQGRSMFYLPVVIIASVFGAMSGTIMGRLGWYGSERNYQNYVNQKK